MKQAGKGHIDSKIIRFLDTRPKTGKVPIGQAGDVSPDLPVILSGTIDLIFKESGGWVIVDYKTDDPGGDPARLQALIDYYAPQLRIYSQFWSQITSEPIKEAGLYFSSLEKYIKIS